LLIDLGLDLSRVRVVVRLGDFVLAFLRLGLGVVRSVVASWSRSCPFSGLML